MAQDKPKPSLLLALRPNSSIITKLYLVADLSMHVASCISALNVLIP